MIIYKTKESEEDFKPVIGKMPHLHELADAVAMLGLDVLISKKNFGCVWSDGFNVVHQNHKAYMFNSFTGTIEVGVFVSRGRVVPYNQPDPPNVVEFERCVANILKKMSSTDVFWTNPLRKEQTTLGYREVSETVHVMMPEFSSAEELKLKLELMR